MCVGGLWVYVCVYVCVCNVHAGDHACACVLHWHLSEGGRACYTSLFWQGRVHVCIIDRHATIIPYFACITE